MIEKYTSWMQQQFVNHDYRLMWDIWNRFLEEFKTIKSDLEELRMRRACESMAIRLKLHFLFHSITMKYTIGNDENLTIPELYEKLKELTNKRFN